MWYKKSCVSYKLEAYQNLPFMWDRKKTVPWDLDWKAQLRPSLSLTNNIVYLHVPDNSCFLFQGSLLVSKDTSPVRSRESSVVGSVVAVIFLLCVATIVITLNIQPQSNTGNRVIFLLCVATIVITPNIHPQSNIL